MTDQLASAPPDDTATSQARGQLRGLARGGTANLAGAIAMALCNFALTIGITRGLSQTAAGIFFSVTSLFLLAATVGRLGTDTGLVYFLSRSRALDAPGLVREYLRAALSPVLVATAVMGAALFLFAPQVAVLTNPDHADRAATYLRVFAVFIPLVGLENVYVAATRGLGTMRVTAVVEQLGRPLLQLLLVLGALLLPGTGLVGWAWALAYLPAAIVAWWWWRRRSAPYKRLAPARRTGRGPEFWRFTAPRAFASLAQIAMQRLDIVLVGALAGAGQAAVYTAATRFLVIGQMANRAISMAVQPRLAAALARDDRATANRLYQVSTAWLMLLSWPVLLTLIVLGTPLLHVFGETYAAGATVLIVLAGSMLVATACGMVDMVLMMAGRTSWNLVNVLLAFGTNLALDLWLIPDLGLLGAAIGWAVAILVKNLSSLLLVGIVLRLHPFGGGTARAAALAAICFAAVPGVARLLAGPTWVALVGGIGVGACCYLALAWPLRERLHLSVFGEMVGRLRPRRGPS